MDEVQDRIAIKIAESAECVADTRDENRSPTSGSSSEAYAEDGRERRGHRNRKHSSATRTKRKRKWKPYNEMSWDEKRVHDDRETRRAYAKRERLSAEGHPIAPYNTTQFLMDDRGAQQHQSRKLVLLSSSGGGLSPAAIALRTGNNRTKIVTIPDGSGSNKKEYNNSTTTTSSVAEETSRGCNDEGNADHCCVGENNNTTNSSCNNPQQQITAASDHQQQLPPPPCQKHLPIIENITDSPLITVDAPPGERSGGSVVESSQNEEDIQKYIMDDFSHTYADIHAEQLQMMSKADLVVECLKLERKVDALERRVKDCKRKHKYDHSKGRTDVHLLEKINQLQTFNAQLQNDKGSVEKSAATMPVSDHGACI